MHSTVSKEITLQYYNLLTEMQFEIQFATVF